MSDERWHGTDTGYCYHRCRCPLCTEAHRLARRKERKPGSRSKVMRERYAQARAAGFTGAEARKRQHWANPLA